MQDDFAGFVVGKSLDELLKAVKGGMRTANKELQEREAEAEKIRLEIEAKGRANLTSAENEARAMTSLGESYQDNRAVLQYQLHMRGLEVAEELLLAGGRVVGIEAAALFDDVMNLELEPEQVEEVALGCAMPEAEQGMNVGRIATCSAGLPDTTPARTMRPTVVIRPTIT